MATSKGGPGGTTAPAGPMVPCRFCGRSFAPDAQKRHEPICTKATLPKRPPFDSHKQRMEGTDLKAFNSAPSVKSRAPQKVPSAPRNNWRQRHEEFMGALANARETKRAIEKGGPLPPPPPPSINPDYIQCKFCGRRFNEAAAERHIPFCQSKGGKGPGSVPVLPGGNKSSNAGQEEPDVEEESGENLGVDLQGGGGGPRGGGGKGESRKVVGGENAAGQLVTGQLTTLQLTKGELTKGELTKGELTKGQLTKGQLTKEELTKGQLTKGQLTKEELTKGQMTKEQLIKGQLTKEQMTKGELTKGELTTGQLTKEQLTKGQFTKGELTKGELTEGQLTKEQLTTEQMSGDNKSNTVVDKTVVSEKIKRY